MKMKSWWGLPHAGSNERMMKWNQAAGQSQSVWETDPMNERPNFSEFHLIHSFFFFHPFIEFCLSSSSIFSFSSICLKSSVYVRSQCSSMIRWSSSPLHFGRRPPKLYSKLTFIISLLFNQLIVSKSYFLLFHFKKTFIHFFLPSFLSPPFVVTVQMRRRRWFVHSTASSICLSIVILLAPIIKSNFFCRT